MKNPVNDRIALHLRNFGLTLGGTLGDYAIRWHLLEPYNPKTEREDRMMHRKAYDDTLGFRTVRNKS